MAEVIQRRRELASPSPMMEQYFAVKDKYDDFILMYRLGDFFECFFEDAIIASEALELTLTGRDCGEGKRAAMCGVPFHKADQYIGKLVEKGYKVAVCEQTEDPAAAKGLVKREVVRVVTPGTVTDGSLLNDRSNNFLAALCYTPSGIGVAFADISTGQMYATELTGDNLTGRLRNELFAYSPSEILLNISASKMGEAGTFAKEFCHAVLTDKREELFDEKQAARLADEYLGKKREDITAASVLSAVGALLAYIRETQMCAPSFVRELTVYSEEQYMELDYSTRRNLELVENLRSKEKRGSLLWVLDKTKTAMGARTLRAWVLKPQLSVTAILAREEAVAAFTDRFLAREETRTLLASIPDLERLTAKVAYGTASARDLRAIAQGLSYLPALKALLASLSGARMQMLAKELDALEDVYAMIDAAIEEEPPFSVREGGMIRAGYNEDVDYLRAIFGNATGWKEEIEAREREATGIKTLKVGYNQVFGYYIEVSKLAAAQVPDRYIRKQTLTNCERYITKELKEMESTILGAEDKLCALEYQLFCDLRAKVAALAERIQKTAAEVAEADVYAALAEVAVENRYVCPTVTQEGGIDIKEGRHPVVERFVQDSYFVPNDTKLDGKENRLMLITGPNMAGKSTYMRQVALIALMAQIGSFVPATAASLGIVDKVFTRVGASDDLASGQSTFMLEMTEVAHILKNATARSLIVYDEIGRGTSTYDGMSIARAVAEYTLSKKIGAKTLFATHYHELTVLEEEAEGVVNYNIAAKKKADGIVFLRKIVRGATDDSYGIDVAKLAGVPSEVINRARKILTAIEEGKEAPSVSALGKREPHFEEPDMLSMLEDREASAVAERLRATDVNVLTPIEAMNLLYELKKMLSE